MALGLAVDSVFRRGVLNAQMNSAIIYGVEVCRCVEAILRARLTILNLLAAALVSDLVMVS